MKHVDMTRESRRVELLDARQRVTSREKDAKALAVSKDMLQAEETQKEAMLSQMQAVREQMRLWWR